MIALLWPDGRTRPLAEVLILPASIWFGYAEPGLVLAGQVFYALGELASASADRTPRTGRALAPEIRLAPVLQRLSREPAPTRARGRANPTPSSDASPARRPVGRRVTRAGPARARRSRRVPSPRLSASTVDVFAWSPEPAGSAGLAVTRVRPPGNAAGVRRRRPGFLARGARPERLAPRSPGSPELGAAARSGPERAPARRAGLGQRWLRATAKISTRSRWPSSSGPSRSPCSRRLARVGCSTRTSASFRASPSRLRESTSSRCRRSGSRKDWRSAKAKWHCCARPRRASCASARAGCAAR